MSGRAAIILAGGKGKRFQSDQEDWQDKTLTVLLGKPLLVHAIQSVQKVVDEIVVCVNEDDRKIKYDQILKKHSVVDVKFVVDEKIDHLGGPLVAIFTGLKAVNKKYCFTLPGDMPLVQPKVIEYMFDQAKRSRLVVPMWPNGRLETLSMVLEKTSVMEIAETLCMLGRPRSDDLIRGTLNVIFLSIIGEITAVDPKLKSFVNINSKEDLNRLQPRQVQGTMTKTMHINKGDLPTRELHLLRMASRLTQRRLLLEAAREFSSCADHLEKEGPFFWAAISRENEGKCLISLAKQQKEQKLVTEQTSMGKKALLKAAVTYGLEAKMHEDCGCVFLAERARSDKAWCEKHIQLMKTKIT